MYTVVKNNFHYTWHFITYNQPLTAITQIMYIYIAHRITKKKIIAVCMYAIYYENVIENNTVAI